jgi:predicted Rossmann fold nucleotide-binding protein DprA/Smf involved in DNA uptake
VKFAITKIVSGGQTGVDRAALDVAIIQGIPCGGWCPAGRRAEDGPISLHYPLTETGSKKYPKRTSLNVRDSDGTLILTGDELVGGTLLTKNLAVKQKKPFLVVELPGLKKIQTARSWIIDNQIKILNVAGPRESSDKNIYQLATDFMVKLLQSSDQ